MKHIYQIYESISKTESDMAIKIFKEDKPELLEDLSYLEQTVKGQLDKELVAKLQTNGIKNVGDAAKVIQMYAKSLIKKLN